MATILDWLFIGNVGMDSDRETALWLQDLIRSIHAGALVFVFPTALVTLLAYPFALLALRYGYAGWLSALACALILSLLAALPLATLALFADRLDGGDGGYLLFLLSFTSLFFFYGSVPALVFWGLAYRAQPRAFRAASDRR